MNAYDSFNLKEEIHIESINNATLEQAEIVPDKNIFSAIDNSAFLSNLAADIIVGIILTLLVPFYLGWLKKPRNLNFIFSETSTDSQLMKLEAGIYSCTIHPIFEHGGGNPFLNEIFWHLYFPEMLKVEVIDFRSLGKPLENTRGGYRHIYGSVDKNIYEKTKLELPYKFVCKFSPASTTVKKIEIKYFLSTEFGYFPRGLLINHGNTGSKTLNTMSKLTLEIP